MRFVQFIHKVHIYRRVDKYWVEHVLATLYVYTLLILAGCIAVFLFTIDVPCLGKAHAIPIVHAYHVQTEPTWLIKKTCACVRDKFVHSIYSCVTFTFAKIVHQFTQFVYNDSDFKLIVDMQLHFSLVSMFAPMVLCGFSSALPPKQLF